MPLVPDDPRDGPALDRSMGPAVTVTGRAQLTACAAVWCGVV